jgi:hypothetical protein
VTEANDQEVVTARTESQLLLTSEGQTQLKKITAEQIEQLNQIKSADLQRKISSTGQS